jgi:uncharacterized transporter YbjL
MDFTHVHSYCLRYTQRFLPHLLASALLLLIPLSVFGEDAGGAFINPLGEVTLYEFLYLILNSVVYIVFPFIVLMIVYTGFLFVSA